MPTAVTTHKKQPLLVAIPRVFLTLTYHCCFWQGLEANYGHQQELEMIPSMLEMIPLMQQDFRAKGWLGLILGTRMYFNFYPSAVKSERGWV